MFGIETEYGILAPSDPDADPALLSAAVVACYPGVATTAAISDEVPNRVLGNGARLYVDHAHPEYSTPEVTTALAGLAHDLAGEAVVLAGAAAASAEVGLPIELYKNNTDSHGASYGCHENHLLPRRLSWERIAAVLPAFLVARSALVGAGRVGRGRHGEQPGFQLSQRADFFETLEGVQTTKRRPLLNTRDEPHAPRSAYRRLHVITGDANRNQFATWLKLGSLAGVLTALADDDHPDALPTIRLADPVAAFAQFSHDPTLRATVPTDRGDLTALDLLELVAEAVHAHAGQRPEAHDQQVLAAWDEALADLRTDPSRCADRLDWMAKLELLHAYRARHGIDTWTDPRLAALDLAWARLGPNSPFAALQRAGRQRVLVSEAEVRAAEQQPPEDTRAWLRGRLVAADPSRVLAADWASMLVGDRNGRRQAVELAEPLRHTRAEVGELDDPAAVDALLHRWG